jgi:hypothetical protein
MGYGALMEWSWGATRVGGLRTEAFSHHTVSLFAGSVSVMEKSTYVGGMHEPQSCRHCETFRLLDIHWV